MKKLKKEHTNLTQSNQELDQNISNIQKIIDKNKISSIKSFSELENTIKLNKQKIVELNNTNKNLLNFQKKYENKIGILQKNMKDYDFNNKDFEQFKINDKHKVKDFNLLNDIEKLKISNSNLQKEILKLESTYNFEINNLNFTQDLIDLKNNSSINELLKLIQNKNEEYLNEIKEIQNEIKLKDKKLDESNNEIKEAIRNLLLLKEENKREQEYVSLKNKNKENLDKLNILNTEIQNLMLNFEQMKIDYKQDIDKLNNIYNTKKENIMNKTFENELKKIIEENEKIKKENFEIIKSLEDLKILNNTFYQNL